MTNVSIPEQVKIAIALRTARTAIGWNQQEFADILGVAKSTIARIETLEAMPRADLLLHAMEEFIKAGVEVDLFNVNRLNISIGPNALQLAELRLMNEELRRSDRRGGLSALVEAANQARQKIQSPLAIASEQLVKRNRPK